jgi:hypothetical protein
LIHSALPINELEKITPSRALPDNKNHNEPSVLSAVVQIREFVVGQISVMRLIFEALFIRPEHLVQRGGVPKRLGSNGRDR